MVPSASDAFTSCPVFRMFLYQGWCDLQHLPLLPPFFFNSFAAHSPAPVMLASLSAFAACKRVTLTCMWELLAACDRPG